MLRLGLIFLLLPLTLMFALTATAQNRVLELDGDADYVQLPSDIFNDLSEATVEGWVKWERLGYFSQPFGFGSGENWRTMAVNNGLHLPDLQYFIYIQMKLYLIRVPDILRLHQWCHIAAVSGRKGMRLYFNGVLVGEHEYTGSFSAIANGKYNTFGKPHWSANDDFKGQLDEIRVWKVARTGEDIRASMHRKLTGKERGLVGLWSFDSGDAKDSSENRYDGVLHGDAHCVEAELPTLSDLVRPVVLSGVVTDETGEPLARADVCLEQGGKTIAKTITDEAGQYRMVFYPSSGLYDLSATWNEKGDWRLRVRFSPGEHRTLDLTLRQAISISGTLLAYDNSFHAGICVQAVRMNPAASEYPQPKQSEIRNPKSEMGTVVASTLSDESGQYRFINLKPGPYRVRCYTPGNYIYYGEESQESKKAHRQELRNPKSHHGDVLHVTRRTPLSNVNFRFAPFKKGTWQTYTYLDGLASNKVYAIESDATGSVWFATEGGVSRYDGRNFVSFTERDGLLSNWVTSVCRDDEGNLWFGTRDGVSRYDGRGFVNYTREDGLPGNYVSAMYRDAEGALWIATSGGVSHYDGRNFVIFTKTNGLANNLVRAICQDSDGIMWFGTSNGLSRFDKLRDRRSKKQFTTFRTQDGLVHNDIRAIHQDTEGVLWIGTDGGVSRYDGKTFVNFTTRDGLPHNRVSAITEGEEGALWFGTKEGLSRYDGEGFIPFTTHDGLAYNWIRAMYRDAQGVLWIGTHGGGVSCYDSKTFVNFTTRDGLPHNRVFAIAEDKKGTMWFGTAHGASCYDGKRFVNFTTQDGLAHNSVHAIHRSPDGNLWFGTDGGGLSRYDGQRFETFDREDGLASGRVNVIHGSPDSALWIGMSSLGISKAITHPKMPDESQGDTPLRFQTLTQKDGLLDCHVRAIDSDGTAFRLAGTWVKYAFRVPAELYDHRLIEEFRVTFRHDNTDAACPTSCKGCDGWPVKLYCYDYENSEYDHWKDLTDTGDGVIRTVEVTTPDIYEDDDQEHIGVPGSDDEYIIWFKIDAPDGAGGADCDDDGNTDINDIAVTLILKQPHAPGLVLAAPDKGSNSKVNVPRNEEVAFTIDPTLPSASGYTHKDYWWKKVLASAAAPSPTDDFDYTSGVTSNIRFNDPENYKVYCKVVYKKSDSDNKQRDTIISDVLAIPVQAWVRPTVQNTPPEARIDAGDVSWYSDSGKYVGVKGHPVRLMAEGETGTVQRQRQIRGRERAPGAADGGGGNRHDR